MGTRSLTHIIDVRRYKNDKGVEVVKKNTLLTMYKQYDGYPEGLGIELATFLKGGTVVNGIGMDATNVFNGAGCLAASLIANLKTEAGNVYITTPNQKAEWEDYVYTITVDGTGKDSVKLKCVEVGYDTVKDKKLFEGTPQAFLDWVDKVKA